MASAKTFDLSISLRSRTDGGADYTFSSLPKDDAGPIKAFLEARKVRVKDKTEDEIAAAILSDDGDDDMMSDDDDDDSDAGGRKKSKGKERERGPVTMGGGDLGDDDESGAFCPTPFAACHFARTPD